LGNFQLKRIAFALFAALLFYLIIFAFAKGNFLFGGVASAALIAIMVFGSRLEAKSVTEKLTNQFKQYAEQAQWSGSELMVKPRWFKRLCFAVIWLGIFLTCLNGVLTFRHIAEEKPLLFFTLIGASLVFGYSAWLTLAGFFREILAGYCLKLNSHGFTLAGHPTIPWDGVYRAGHMWFDNKGIVHHFLDLEFSADEIQGRWPSKIRPFLIGPLAIALPILRRRGEFKLRGTFLALPVPTIVTAICQIGSRHAPHPIVQLNHRESLEDARRLAVLLAKARQPIDQSDQESAFKRAAAAFSKPGGAVDSADLVAAMTKLDQGLTAQSDAFKEYSQLQNKVLTQSGMQFRKKIDRDKKILNWVFGGAFLLVTLYYLLRWVVG
jgi:hypothetical protein